MKEAALLIERARKYLKSAAVLLKEEDFESTVSRAYYAMFYCAEAALLTKGLSFSSHKAVISAFGEHFVKTDVFPREMGKELGRAFQKRQLGDYEYTFVISRQEAEEVLDNAGPFVEAVSKYLADAAHL